MISSGSSGKQRSSTTPGISGQFRVAEIPKKRKKDTDDTHDDDDEEDDSHIPNEYDESELDSKIRFKKPTEADFSDPLDKRNHSITIITPMSMSIAESVKARRGRKRSRYNDIDREYLLASFDPALNTDMDDVDTLLHVLKKDDEEENQIQQKKKPGREDAATERDSDEDQDYVPSGEDYSDDLDDDDEDDADYEEDGASADE